MKKYIIFSMLMCANLLLAKVSLPYIFSDNMVLQRESKIPIWGIASAQEKITVTFKNQKKETIADQNGKWKINLDGEKAGGPYQLTVAGENTIHFSNVLVGDVWLASGQSNMEWNLGSAEGFDAEKKQKNFPMIRQIKIEKKINSLPQSNISETSWKVADTSTVADFSAVAYFFAKELYQKTGVPIGIINSSWGGTVIETWIPRDAFEHSDEYKSMIANMPKISIEELQQKNIAEKKAFIEKLTQTKIGSFDEKKFNDPAFSDASLPEMEIPKPWENQGYTALDGIVWFRKTITLTEADLQGEVILHLGKIDDEDTTYINGVQVGQMNQWSDDRIYTIPAKFLKPGANVITVKVKDNGGGGGFWSEPAELFLKTSARDMPLAGKWKFAVEKIFDSIDQNEFPSLIYNAMIHPIEQYAIKGIIWYQGESNEERAYQYNKAFPLLINSWRERFGENTPFYYVQLATFRTKGNNSNEGSAWAELREAQTNTLQLKNTGMVVTTDIGNAEDIHPRNKKTVGERLAFLALNTGKVSPTFKDDKIANGKIVISFTPSVSLVSQDGKALRGFEIAGDDRVFHAAAAEINGNKISVYSKEVPEPKSVRYGWKGDNSELNLFSTDGLPVSPFRTDKHKTVTADVKYSISR